MEFDSRMISIVGVILVISLSYFVYLIYQDVLGLKTKVEEIKNELLPDEHDYEEEFSEGELSDEEELSEGELSDEEIEQEVDRVFEINEPIHPIQPILSPIQELPEEPEAPQPLDESAQELVPIEPSNDTITNTSVKKRKRTATKKNTPVALET